MDNFFRSLFGFPQRRPFNPDNPTQHDDEHSFHNKPPFNPTEEHEMNPNRGGMFFFGMPPPFFGGHNQHPFGNGPHDEENDGRSEGFHSPGGSPFHEFGHGSGSDDMFRHFDDMFRSFDAVFRGMGPADFPGFSQQVPSVEDTPSLRDRMLKEPDTRHPNQGVAPPIPNNRSPTFMDKMWDFPNWARKPGAHDKLDRDLDEELKRGDLGLDSILEANMDPDAPPRPPPPQMDLGPDSPTHPPRSRFKTISVRTIRGADGRLEERRTMVDGRGNQSTTVTRTLGDQTHTQTTTRNHRGEEEVAENFSNMDHKDKESFDRVWATPHLEPDNRLNDSGISLRNLFRLGFPGFINSYKST